MAGVSKTLYRSYQGSINTWVETSNNRELALRKRHFRAIERLTEHTQKFPDLKVGDHVRIQNQTGTHPRKWDRTGIVIEVRQYDQYVVRVDGSGRVTLRNRRFLRRFTPYLPTIINQMTTRYPATMMIETKRSQTPIIEEKDTSVSTTSSLPSPFVPPIPPALSTQQVTPPAAPLTQPHTPTGRGDTYPGTPPDPTPQVEGMSPSRGMSARQHDTTPQRSMQEPPAAVRHHKPEN